VLAFGVASAPRSVAFGVIHWIRDGIGRRLDGLASNLSGKPTFLSVLLNDSWVAAYDPKWPLGIKENHVEVVQKFLG